MDKATESSFPVDNRVFLSLLAIEYIQILLLCTFSNSRIRTLKCYGRYTNQGVNDQCETSASSYIKDKFYLYNKQLRRTYNAYFL